MAVIPSQRGLDNCPASPHPLLGLPKLLHILAFEGLCFPGGVWISCPGVGGTVSPSCPWQEFPSPRHRRVPQARPFMGAVSCRGLAW